MLEVLSKNWDVREVSIDLSRDNDRLFSLIDVFSETMNSLLLGEIAPFSHFETISRQLGFEDVRDAYTAIQYAQWIHAKDDLTFMKTLNANDDNPYLPSKMVLLGEDVEIKKMEIVWRRKCIAVLNEDISDIVDDIQWILISRRLKNPIPEPQKTAIRNDMLDKSMNYKYTYRADIRYSSKPLDTYGDIALPKLSRTDEIDDIINGFDVMNGIFVSNK